MARPQLRPGEIGTISKPVKDAGGFWTAKTRYRDLSGRIKQITRRGKTAKEARARTEADARRAAGQQESGLHAQSTVGEVAEAWLEVRRKDVNTSGGIRPQTWENYEMLVRLFVKPEVGGVPISDLTVGRIEAVLSRIAAAKTRETAQSVKKVLSMTSQHAVRHGAIDIDRAAIASVPRSPIVEPRIFSLRERALLKHAAARYDAGVRGKPGRMLDLVELLEDTGLRVGEALALRVQDVSISRSRESGEVRVRGTIVKRLGKGKWKRAERQSIPKTNRSIRDVPLSKQAARVILRRLDILSAKHGVPVKDLGRDLLLFSTASGRPEENHGRAWKKIRERAGFPVQRATGLHAWRRTFASEIAAELGIDAAAQILGHSAAGVTVRSYAPQQRTASVSTTDWIRER